MEIVDRVGVIESERERRSGDVFGDVVWWMCVCDVLFEFVGIIIINFCLFLFIFFLCGGDG